VKRKSLTVRRLELGDIEVKVEYSLTQGILGSNLFLSQLPRGRTRICARGAIIRRATA